MTVSNITLFLWKISGLKQHKYGQMHLVITAAQNCAFRVVNRAPSLYFTNLIAWSKKKKKEAQSHTHCVVYLRSTHSKALPARTKRSLQQNCFVADVSMEKVSNWECSLFPCLSVAISAGLLGVAFLLGSCVCFTYCFPVPFGQEPFYNQAR